MKAAYIILCIVLAACASRPVYIAPVMVYPTLQENKLGKTVCSWNNRPVSLIDEQVLASTEAELTNAHEQNHANNMFYYRGGCWAYLYRYMADSAFRFQGEYRAYCAEAQFALTRNRNPVDIWAKIKIALIQIDSVRGQKARNCVYED